MKKFELYEVPLEFGRVKMSLLNAAEVKKDKTPRGRVFEANNTVEAFLANNTQEELKAILNAASQCLAEERRAQSWIDSRLGAGAWREALKHGWGACLRTPTNLYFETPEAAPKQPPSIVIPLLEPDTRKIVGFSMRRFLAVENETGGFDHPALPKIIFQNVWKKGQWEKSQVSEKDGARWKVFGCKEYLNYFDDANAERPCFVVEGFFDWLALKRLGFNAVCLNGAPASPLVAYVKGKAPRCVFIMMGDNDSKESGHGSGAGEKSDEDARSVFETDPELLNVKILSKGFLHGQTPEWRQWLDSKGIKDAADFYKAGIKDETIRAKMLDFVGGLEALAIQSEENPIGLLDEKNPKIPTQKVESVEKAADEEFEAFLFDEKAPLALINAADADADFEAYVDRFDKIGVFETPWAALNEKLDGGLKPAELVILGGVPNVGKTACALQIADFVAQKHPVIFFTLEMPWETLYARSLARVGHTLGFDYTASKFKKGRVPPEVKRRVVEAYQKEVGNNLQFCNPRGALKVGRIYVEAKRFIKATGEPPLIIVDYFQILKSSTKPERALEKEKVDGVVWELKQVALALNVPILAISTLGRDSYSKPLTLACYKESGSIEYTTDAALVLNTALNENRPLKPTDPKNKNEIDYEKQVVETGMGDVVIKVLKNRGNGGKGSIPLAFEPRAETFWNGSVEEVDWARRKAQGLPPRGDPDWQAEDEKKAAAIEARKKKN